MKDLGGWADEKYHISSPLTPEDLEDERIVQEIEQALLNQSNNK